MTTRLETLPIEKIREVSNIRETTGDVRSLAASIEAVGLLNPLTVIAEPEGFYRLVAGHRRLAALKSLGSETVPAYVADFVSESREDVLAAQLVENLQREDLDPLEEAEGLAELVEILGTQGAAAKAIGRSPAHLSKRLKLRQLPDEGKSAVRAGSLNLEQAFELAKLPEKRAAKIAEHFSAGNSHAPRELADEIKALERDEVSRKAARDVAGQAHRQDMIVVASPDAEDSWQTLEGWNGLAVDQDLHEAEPCHRLVVGYQNRWSNEIREEYYCADPDRHGPDGDSDNKIVDTEAQRDEVEEKRRQKALERQAKIDEKSAQLARQAIEVAAGLNRNDAVKVLSQWILRGLEPTRAAELLKVFGVKVPDEPETKPWEDPDSWHNYETAVSETMDSTPDSKLYRAAVLYTLTISTHSPQLFIRERPENIPIAEILGIEIDREEI